MGFSSSGWGFGLGREVGAFMAGEFRMWIGFEVGTRGVGREFMFGSTVGFFCLVLFV